MAQEIDGTAPGPDPAALAAIEANALSQLAALRSGRQALEAYELRLLASLGHLAMERAGGASSERSTMEVRAIAAEIGVHARVSDRTIERQIGDAMHLVETWPLVLDAFADGRIGRGHVRAITEAGSVLASTDVTAEQRAAYEERMVALAETTTPARVAKAARKAADAQLAEPLVDRHRAARDDRRVTIEPADDGMAWIGAYVPAILAHGIDHRLRAGARTKPKDDPRTIDQWRADAFCELLLTGTGAPSIERTAGSGGLEHGGAGVARAGLLSTIRPVVQVTIPVTTLTGHDDAPASLDGDQPIDAETARILAGVAATWERLLTDPIRGTVLEVDTYQPTAAQRRLLIARDQHCRFPGCAAHAHTADLDHTIAWDHDGTTALGNLAHLCRRHHTLKHASAWTVHQPRPGELHWRSPAGRTYLDRPPPTGPTFTDASESTAAIAADDAWGPPTSATDADTTF
ncbi:HNH endonuclease signature motif containing protein [Agrococcus sp. SGAir0287]|uniref:HNH endonuclease signature motif containing protein n=1 Tax=Agrococcus sp. SGAir0287 TaxID=2070347 RepID=UPI001586D6BE|nr:HNH endonuclease signature motif containing protein [Agrococcus sp. SGAir0287]